MNAITASSHTHVGTPRPGYYQDWVTHTVHWHGFESLSTVRGVPVHSPQLLYPGGSYELSQEGMISIDLCNMSNKAIEVDYDLCINDGDGVQVAIYESSRHTKINFGPAGSDDDFWGTGDFADHYDVISALIDGALVINVRMRLSVPLQLSPPPPFIPENPLTKMIQGVFLEEKSTDIVFEVKVDQPRNNAPRVARLTPITFRAHRLIIENCSSIFANLCESHHIDSSTTPTIQINDLTPDIFRHLLNYIYGGKISVDDMKSHAKEMIDAADKYGVVNLKLEAEACLVEGTTFTIENVMEHLLYAESKNCALLKEASMDYILKNKAEAIEKLSFANAPGALITDVLAAVSRGERVVGGGSGGDGGDNERHFNAMRISELRKRAHEKGLNVDGSREMLIAALKSVQEAGVGAEDGSEELDEEPEVE
jgi:speckle-type POZ protein